MIIIDTRMSCCNPRFKPETCLELSVLINRERGFRIYYNCLFSEEQKNILNLFDVKNIAKVEYYRDGKVEIKGKKLKEFLELEKIIYFHEKSILEEQQLKD